MRLFGFLLGASISVAAVVAACSSDKIASDFPVDPGDAAPPEAGPLDGLASIDVTPAEATLVAGDTNGTQAFTALGHFANGTSRDITNEVTWKSSVSAVVDTNGPTAKATGSRGGEALVSAFSGSVTGSAKVHVDLKKTVLGAGVDAAAAARFTNATEDATLAPTTAYPLTGALVPPNLPALEFQWKPAANTDLFDIGITGPNLDIHFVTKCTTIDTGCGATPDDALWASITATLGGLDAATVKIRAAGTAPGKIGTSAPLTTQFAAEDLRGGLYYFNTKPVPPTNKAGIYRYDFETKKVGPFFDGGEGTVCAGCHALSPDGTKMLAPVCRDASCTRPVRLAVVDVATKQVVTPALPVGDSDTQTWSPDNKFYITTPQCKGGYGAGDPVICTGNPKPGKMVLVDATSNTAVIDIPAKDGALYPSFSSDGKKIVYAVGGELKTSLSMLRSSIYTMTIDTTKSPPTFGPETALVTAGVPDYENDYHPSFSPDDKWVLFTRSTCVAGDHPDSPVATVNECDTYNDPTARTFVVDATGGVPIELAIANGQGRNTVSWPKWSPFQTKTKGGNVYWVTVASNRDYGFRDVHMHDAAGNPTTGVTQLWLVAFDPAKALAHQDPSYAPVWLPFQDVTSSNHIGQWTTKIVGGVN